jgi:hypothetical protein
MAIKKNKVGFEQGFSESFSTLYRDTFMQTLRSLADDKEVSQRMSLREQDELRAKEKFPLELEDLKAKTKEREAKAESRKRYEGLKKDPYYEKAFESFLAIVKNDKYGRGAALMENDEAREEFLRNQIAALKRAASGKVPAPKAASAESKTKPTADSVANEFGF